MVQRFDRGGASLSDGRIEQFNAAMNNVQSSPVVGPTSVAPPAPNVAPNAPAGAPQPGSAEFNALSRPEQIAIERTLGIAPGQAGAGGTRMPTGPQAPISNGTRQAPPQPRTEPTAPSGGTRDVPKQTPTAGRDLGGRGDTTAARTFAQTGGSEAARRGITGNVQSGRSLFSNPGANRNMATGAGGESREVGRSRRGLSLTRGTGGSPGEALAAPSGAGLEGGGGELEELLAALQLR